MTFLSLVGERLKQARSSLGLSQAEIAVAVGVSREYWGRCERGASVPGGEVLAALVTLGADVPYILTGRQDMPQNGVALNEPLLVQVIAGIEQVIAKSGKDISAPKKARMIATLYRAVAPNQELDVGALDRLMDKVG